MIERLRRWWRRKGHGVHSPYAYRLVTEVFTNPGAYYAYPALERTAARTGEAVGWLRLLHRLTCEFAPQAVQVGETLTEGERAAILAADSRIRLTRSGEAAVSLTDEAPQTLPDTGVMIIKNIPPAQLDALTAGRTHGMVFSHRLCAVIVMRPDLPAQRFEI